MREIKFRVWDSSIKDFLTVDEINPHLFYNLGIPYNLTEILFYHLKDENNGGWDRFVVQQYTGVKDKNGKEIYEGDIIKVTYKMDEHGELEDFTDTVIFYEGSFGTKDDTLFNWSFTPGFSMEVVDNIFENPKLLK